MIFAAAAVIVSIQLALIPLNLNALFWKQESSDSEEDVTIKEIENQLTFVSANLRNEHAWNDSESIYRSWSNTRLDLFKQLLQNSNYATSNPSIIGVQEGTVKQCNDVLDILNRNGNFRQAISKNYNYKMIGQGRMIGNQWGSQTLNSRNELCCIYYNNDLFNLLDYGTFWLSETPQIPNSTYSLAKYPRIATWIQVSPKKESKLSFLVVNLHLSHVSEEARISQMNIVIKFISEMMGNIQKENNKNNNNNQMFAIIFGDFNDFAPYSSLWNNTVLKKENNLMDAFEYCKKNNINVNNLKEPIKTYHKWQGESFIPENKYSKSRIDWFLTSNNIIANENLINITNCQVSRASGKKNKQTMYPSDHFQIVLTVAI